MPESLLAEAKLFHQVSQEIVIALLMSVNQDHPLLSTLEDEFFLFGQPNWAYFRHLLEGDILDDNDFDYDELFSFFPNNRWMISFMACSMWNDQPLYLLSYLSSIYFSRPVDGYEKLLILKAFCSSGYDPIAFSEMRRWDALPSPPCNYIYSYNLADECLDLQRVFHDDRRGYLTSYKPPRYHFFHVRPFPFEVQLRYSGGWSNHIDSNPNSSDSDSEYSES